MFSIFILGLLSGLHCIAMCGNLVFANILKDLKSKSFLSSSLPYNLGRATSYTLLGAILGFLGRSINLSSVQPYALLLASIVMLVIGLNVLGVRFPEIKFLKLPSEKLYSLVFSKIFKVRKSPKIVSPFLLGTLTGFMPCTPLQAAQIYAATTSNPLNGALVMFTFWLGTLPALFLLSLTAFKASKTLLSKVKLVSAAVVLILAVLMFDRSLVAFGSKYSISKAIALIKESKQEQNANNPSNFSKTIRIEQVSYHPDTIVVPAGTPVRLVVERNENSPCSNELVLPEVGIRQVLKPFGKTEIILPPLKPGMYRMTCQMYMMEGYIIAKDNN